MATKNKTAKRKPAKRSASVKQKPATVLVLRTNMPNMSGTNENARKFIWPESGPVSCPDWDPHSGCGNGLHGLLWGEGNGEMLRWQDDSKWLVVEVIESEIVDLSGKVKFPRGTVVHCGDRESATAYIAEHGALGRAICGAIISAGDRGTATAGDRGTATAGDRGTATAGVSGTATAGYGGTATAGYGGTATAGDRGTVVIKRWDAVAERYRVSVGEIGENGLKPNVKYRLDDKGGFIEVV